MIAALVALAMVASLAGGFFHLRHLKVFLLITIRIIHLLMLLRLIALHARFVGNLDILLWTVTTE